MMAKALIERGEAGDTAPTPNVARYCSKATVAYNVAGIGSTAYAARVIGERCNLSPAVALKVVELGGIGGDA